MSEQEIYLELMNRPDPADRSRFLDHVCAGNELLRNRVENLIRQSDQLGSFLEHSPHALAATADLSVVSERPRALLGPYKLLEQIGEGGMGVVYMAQQIEPVKRKVALKLIKPGMDTRQVIARFEAERQALALMDHPNIARIYDAGTTESSRHTPCAVADQAPSSLSPVSCPLPPSSARPFFVMELVRGIPITDYCDKQRLNTQDPLKLFLDVCHAVQHAHQRGIIHRDLKPSNVLVTLHDGSPVVKVIDFGVAKALNQELTERTLFTQFSQMVGTPLYMSPEQAELSGLDIDTRTDVYSLGVLLYELLTGTTPFDKDRLKSATFDEMRRIIREEEPETVSARIARTRGAERGARNSERGTENQQVAPRSPLRVPRFSELDWIAAKSLEKDRSRRYESASALAADIQRYLTGDPVLAHPPTPMYRFQKFARKHKVTLTTAAAIALCLLLGTTVSAWQAARATTAEAEANANAIQADEKAKEATEQRDEVKSLNDKLRHTLYIAHVNMARHAWREFAIDQMTELLDQQRPQQVETDLRGFEWHYLNRLRHMEPLLTLKGHTHGVKSVAISRDGRRIATASSGRVLELARPGTYEWVPVSPELKIWNAETGRELLSLKGHTGHVNGVAFSTDGKRLASAGSMWDDTTKTNQGGVAKIWDAETGQKLMTLKGDAHTLHAVAFSPDGKRLASGGSDGINAPKSAELKIWSAQTGEVLSTLKGHTLEITNIAFSPDGTRLASSSWDYTARVWNVQTGEELLSVYGGFGGIISFSPDGKRFANGSHIYDALTGKSLQKIHLFNAHGMLFSPNGKHLLSTAHEQPVRIYNSLSGEELFSFRSNGSGYNDAVYSSDGKRLAFAHQDGTVTVWNAATSPEYRPISGHESVSGVAFSPDGTRLLSADRSGILKLSDVRTGRELLSIKSHEPAGYGPGVAYSPDGKRLASAFSGQLKVWDAVTGKELHTLESGRGGRKVAFSPDGKRLATSGTQLKVWDAESGKQLFSVFVGQINQALSLAFSPDGKRIACGGGNRLLSGGVQFFDAESGQKELFLKEPNGAVAGVAYSPDGKRVASGSTGIGRAVRIWDADSGQELLSLKGHTGSVRNVVFSPDGKRLATHSEPLMLKVFDAQTGQETLSLKGGNAGGLAFSPDGHLLAGGAWNEVMLYDATPLPEKP